MRDDNNRVKTSIFSKTELKVVELLSRGYSEKEIADKMFISQKTVNNHMRNIRERHQLNNNKEVILLYISYLKKKPFSIKKIRELGIDIILVFVSVCQYTGTGW